jgi:hypothetical protein
MAEQSHKKDMADALRGDFQRLRMRGVAPVLGGIEEPDVAAAPAVRGTATAVVEMPAALVVRPGAASPDVPAPPPGTPSAAPIVAEPTRRRSLFVRLTSRS